MRHFIMFAGLAGLAVATLGSAVASDDLTFTDEMAEQYAACAPDAAELALPLSRSGLDLVPVYANGYAHETQAGSPFAQQDLTIRLRKPEGLQAQLAAYLACDTPIMRLTQGQALLAAEVTAAHEGSAMIAFYQHGWSVGADELRGRAGVDAIADLSGATIAVGPHSPRLDLLAEINRTGREQAEAAGRTWTAPTITTTVERSGQGGDTPERRLAERDGVAAALVTTTAPSADSPTTQLLSTRSANRAISAIYVVRADYFEAHRDRIERLVTALFNAEEQVREDVTTQVVDWQATAAMLLGSADAASEMETLWRQVETVGVRGNADWSRPEHLRSFDRLNAELADEFRALGLLATAPQLQLARLDYSRLAEGVFDQRRAELSSFDPQAARELLSAQRAGGEIDGQTILRFEIYFEANQDDFPASEYADEFSEVLDAAQRYGGALLTIEGHADPTYYLQRKERGIADAALEHQRRGLADLSENRAEAVRASVLGFAEERGVRLDASQLITEGLGIDDPASGLCDGAPCPAETETERAENRRVVFRVVRVDAESEAFTPPTTW